jgi:hypothetical protein
MWGGSLLIDASHLRLVWHEKQWGSSFSGHTILVYRRPVGLLGGWMGTGPSTQKTRRHTRNPEWDKNAQSRCTSRRRQVELHATDHAVPLSGICSMHNVQIIQKTSVAKRITEETSFLSAFFSSREFIHFVYKKHVCSLWAAKLIFPLHKGRGIYGHAWEYEVPKTDSSAWSTSETGLLFWEHNNESSDRSKERWGSFLISLRTISFSSLSEFGLPLCEDLVCSYKTNVLLNRKYLAEGENFQFDTLGTDIGIALARLLRYGVSQEMLFHS